MAIPESASASSDGSSIVNTPTNEPPEEEVMEDGASNTKAEEEEEEGHQGTIDAPIEQVMEDRASAPKSPSPQEGGVSENRDRGLAATEVESMEESVLKFRESIVTPSPKEEVGKTRDVSNNSTFGLATSNKTHGQTSTPRRASTPPPDHTPPRTNKAHGQTYTAPRAGANEAHGQSFTAPRTTRTRGYYTYEANEAHGQSFTAPRTTTTQVPGYSPYPWCFIGEISFFYCCCWCFWCPCFLVSSVRLIIKKACGFCRNRSGTCIAAVLKRYRNNDNEQDDEES